jgi:cytochrome P450
MMLHSIADNPEVEAKLRKSIQEVIKSDADITFDNLKKLHYIDWCQNESLRYGTPFNGLIMRKCKKTTTFADIPIRKRVELQVNALSNQYSPEYSKDPFVYRPERWESECNNLPAFALFGFSGGPRNCIGKQLALLESKIALVKLMLRFKEIQMPSEKRVMVKKFIYEPLPNKITFVKGEGVEL